MVQLLIPDPRGHGDQFLRERVTQVQDEPATGPGVTVKVQYGHTQGSTGSLEGNE